MPGRSSSRRSITPTRSLAPSRPISIAAPTPMPMAAAAAPNTLGQSIKDGFGLGIGVSVADRLVGSFFGPRKVEVAGAPPVASPVAMTTPMKPCYDQEVVLQACLKKTQEGGFGCISELQAYQGCLQKFSGYSSSKE